MTKLDPLGLWQDDSTTGPTVLAVAQGKQGHSIAECRISPGMCRWRIPVDEGDRHHLALSSGGAIFTAGAEV